LEGNLHAKMNSSERILNKAREIGFDLAGMGSAQPASGDEFRRWLEAGRAGGMSWLAKDVDRRIHPAAKTAIVCGLSYFVQNPPPKIWNDLSRGRISRYAWGRDYHDVMRPMLEELAEFVRAETGWVTGIKTNVDTGPVLERDLAAHAGLGFVGKNTNLIHPEFGSYLFLGEVLLDADLGPAFAEASAGRHWTSDLGHASCGPCIHCLKTCPTGALAEPYVLDSRRCISYLTIEHKGAIPEDLRARMGNWIFGCDECQQTCPWNGRLVGGTSRSRAPKSAGLESPAHGKTSPLQLRFDPDLCAPKLVELMALDDAGFRERFAGTPVLRSKRRGLLRNVAVALGNGCDSSSVPVLEKAARDPDPLIREHAEWAIRRLNS
jgi:epoxyqueuosine reductase